MPSPSSLADFPEIDVERFDLLALRFALVRTWLRLRLAPGEDSIRRRLTTNFSSTLREKKRLVELKKKRNKKS